MITNSSPPHASDGLQVEAIGDESGLIFILGVPKSQIVRVLDGHFDAIVWSGKGESLLLSTGEDGKLLLWDVAQTMIEEYEYEELILKSSKLNRSAFLIL